MIKRLIVPLDGSRLSEAVLPTAVLLARKLPATVTLVHVIERNPPKQVHGQPHLSNPEQAEAYLEQVQSRFFPADTQVERHVHPSAISDVARSIVEHAHEFGSDLVLMSTHGRGGLRKLLIGSIAQRVVSLRAPVLLVRPGDKGEAPQPSGASILVPLDGTEVCDAAVQMAMNLATACELEMRLLMVVPTLGTLSGVEHPTRILLPVTTHELLTLAQSDAAEYLQQLAARLSAEGVRVSTAVLRGDPAETIVAEAQRLDAAFIAMGTHGKAGMDAFWSGSVAPKVSDRARLPLLLVPAGGA